MDNGATLQRLDSAVRDFSPAGLFVHADIVVQFVLVLLALASFWCWAIIYGKYTGFRNANRALDAFEQRFWSTASLDELHGQLRGSSDNAMAALFVAAMDEWQQWSGTPTADIRLPERIQRVMRVQLGREIRTLERHLGYLATLGSTGTFIGLFGTVWGIMSSFTSIAASSNTSVTVVAPGIAEALFATAAGLVAAIPAVVAYNRLSAESDHIAERLEGFVDELTAILSRRAAERGQ